MASRRGSLDSIYVDGSQELPPLFDFSAFGKKGQHVFHTGEWVRALLATALFRIWFQLLLFTLWGMMVVLVNEFTTVPFSISSTLLTVLGTILGFVISFRTSSALDSYKEGRRLWSNVIFASRIWARTVWIACPDSLCEKPPTDPEAKERDAVMGVIEKKNMINVCEAFSIALKHYLRGEDGYYYEDLWPLIKYLPGYSLPTSIPDPLDEHIGPSRFSVEQERALSKVPYLAPDITGSSTSTEVKASGNDRETTPATLANSPRTSVPKITINTSDLPKDTPGPLSAVRRRGGTIRRLRPGQTPQLRKSRNPPPPTRLRDLFPFYLFMRDKREDEEKALFRKQEIADAKRGQSSSNVPYELSLYMGSFIATLTKRNSVDVPTRTSLLNSLLMLTDCLTGLERILTTPIPFSFQAHLFVISWIYCLILPFQVVQTLNWVAIPATSLVAFILLGFLSIGNEIENPFGYDANDLHLDQFNQIVRAEMAAITSRPMPSTDDWVFVPDNTHIFGAGGSKASTVELANLDMKSLRAALAAQGGQPDADAHPQSSLPVDMEGRQGFRLSPLSAGGQQL